MVLVFVASLLVIAIVVTANLKHDFELKNKAAEPEGQEFMKFQYGLDGYNGVSDATIRSDRANRNFADDENLIIQADNEMVSLINFDLSSSLPDDAIINDAELKLYLIDKNDNDNISFRMKSYALLADWNVNETTWKNATSSVKWTQEGASKANKDRSKAVSGIVKVTKKNQWYAMDLTDIAQEWVNTPTSNFGLLLRGNNANSVEYHFASSEYSTPTFRPTLSITYSINSNGGGGSPPVGTVEDPVFLPNGGTFDEPVNVAMASVTPGSHVYYTLDGSQPSNNSILYRQPITIDTTATIKAKAYKDGMNESSVSSAVFTINTSSPPPTPPPSGGISWEDVDSWTYQLSSYQNNRLDQIANSNFDLAVVDLARDGYSDYFTLNEVNKVQSQGKKVLAYFEIGAIESYRPEWNQVPDSIKLCTVAGWNQEKYVAYWDEEWWPIVKGRVDQALKSGFDGAYLDMVVTYEELYYNCRNQIGNRSDEDLANLMVDLIDKLSKYAKTQSPYANDDFKIVPQNSPELYTWSPWNSNPNQKYINAIDGLGMEEMYYKATDKPCSQSWCADNRNNAAAIRSAGKFVLSIDYANNMNNIIDAYKKSRMANFIPYTSVRALNVMRVNDCGSSYTCDE